MAKTESTAVNELIELVATAKPLPPDPDEDLMFREPVQAPAPKKTTRMTATVPPIKGAGEVAPLPHARAASGTQSGFPVVPPPVRVSTAPPSRSVTIPPLPPTPAPNPNKQTLMGNGPGMLPSPAATLPPPAPNPSKQTLMGTGSMPPTAAASLPPTNAADLRSTLMGPGTGEPQRPSRPTKPSLPPPRPSGPPAPFTPRATLPPSAPIAAPFDPSIEASIDVPFESSPAPAHLPESDQPFVSSPAYAATAFPAQNAPEHLPLDSALGHVAVPPEWYGSTLVDQSGEPWVGTARVPKQSDWKSIAGKLVGPMLGLVVLGIFIGGYFAFDGEGGKKASSRTTTPAKQVAATEPIKPVLGDNAKAVAGEPAKPDNAQPAHSETPKTDVASTDSAHSDSAHSDSAKSEPAHSEPAHSEPAHSEPAKTDLAKTEPAKTEPAKPEPAKTEPAPAPAKVATPEPAVVTPPNLAPNHTAPGGLVDVRIDTKPAGATVMLVDRGKTMFLGTTPISTSLDPSRKYDLVFTYASKPTQVEHLDPAATKHVAIVLGVAGNQAGKTVAPPKVETPKAPAIAVAPAPKEPKPVTAPKIETPKFEAPKPETPKAEKAEKPVPVKAEKAEKAANDESIRKGQGTLMISSKPPCEIIVDGKSTGLTTPQRAIPLAAGTHKVTLVNSAENIKKTVAITITADQPTKVIQDLMQK